MRITLDLPSDLEDTLSSEAIQLNLPLPEYILQLLVSRSSQKNLPQTGADLIKFWESNGVIKSRPDIPNSQDHARKLRHEAETRAQA